ncbi:class F sortase [Demequina gelatinilytica]|uniref:class F sortase n=1 Tax=Demequina gelatinilytica TaxID=1638980 RepID=UPI0007835B8A|nr:class F sortase [Demequina gelatinilytica]
MRTGCVPRIGTAAVLAALLAACAPAEGRTAVPTVPTPGSASSPDTVAAVTAPVIVGPVAVQRADARVVARRSAPARLVVERLGIDMPVVGVGLDAEGGMELPDSAETAGWFRAAGNPGGGPRGDGNAVLAAHVDDGVVGLGPFAALREARPGDRVLVGLDDGRTVVYLVDRVEQTSKREVDLSVAFGAAERALVLVTCGGRWDADVRHYEDNVLVWAYPEDDPR